MNDFFKGYVVTKNKKCIEKFKDRDDLATLEEISRYPEYAGVLADDTILIDIDDYDQSELLMEMVEAENLICRVYETTRGKHFLFKNTAHKVDKCHTHVKLACGLTADIKVGHRNSYSILKYDGECRKVIYDANDGEDYDVVPTWLYPVKSGHDFATMEAGDGRNQALFSYILTLQGAGLTIDETRKCINLINKWILPTPLSQSEIDSICRDDAFQAPVFYEKNKFLFDKFARYMRANYHIIKLNGRLHVYQDGVYRASDEVIENIMISLIPTLQKSKRKEVIDYLKVLIMDDSYEAGAEYVAFENGVLNVITDDFVDFNADIIITNKIPWRYYPEATCELVDNTLKKLCCGDEGLVSLLEEAVGYCLYRRNELGKAFILTGDGANGKSTFIDMVKTMLGDHNISSLDLNELGDRFKTAELYRKLANVGDDIGEDYISTMSIFKKLVTGERVNAERKGQDPFEFNCYSKFLFSANSIPRMRDKTGAVMRRLVIVPFMAKFTKDDADYRPYIKYELRQQDAIERLIVLGIRGLKRVLDSQAFTEPECVKVALKEYEVENNSIIAFIDEFGVDKIQGEPVRDVFTAYTEFCLSNGLKEAYSKIQFSKQIQQKCDFKVITIRRAGETCKAFTRR